MAGAYVILHDTLHNHRSGEWRVANFANLLVLWRAAVVAEVAGVAGVAADGPWDCVVRW